MSPLCGRRAAGGRGRTGIGLLLGASPIPREQKLKGDIAGTKPPRRINARCQGKDDLP